MLIDFSMKTLFLVVALSLVGCTLPKVIYVPRSSYRMPDYSQPQPFNLVDPLPQHGSSMGFMCRDAINRRDSGGAQVFC